MTDSATPSSPVVRLDVAVPLLAYTAGAAWERVRLPLSSPREDGAVAYFQDSLSRRFPSRNPEWMFEDEVGRALCQYVLSLAHRHGLQIASGPYLQILDDDPSVPDNVVMIRAVLWVEEYDLVVPVTDGAADGPEHASPDLTLRTPDEWCAIYGIEVRDPDGWRSKGDPTWETPISLPEFRRRAGASTVRSLSYETWGRLTRDAAASER